MSGYFVGQNDPVLHAQQHRDFMRFSAPTFLASGQHLIGGRWIDTVFTCELLDGFTLVF
ncbi:hypothetical protein CF161_03251 [Pseudomonas sp. CF161]|nr:hypothetical protein CF161_03251 [Pseudomonas sp. CF161]